MGNLVYDISTKLKTATVVLPNDGIPYSGDIVIPPTIEYEGVTCNVVAIDGAFLANSLITSVTIPNSVETIGGLSFQQTNLTSITIPNSVKKIDFNAFRYCSKLKTVVLGTSVSMIGEHAFANCPDLEDVTCLAEKVPTLPTTNVFEGSLIEYATLHVPAVSVEEYRSHHTWGKFMKIEPIESVEPADQGDQMWWGYFNESDYDPAMNVGLGQPVPFMAGIHVPANHEQVGSSTVKAVRVYIGEGIASTVSEMKIWISKSLPASTADADYVQSVTGSLKNGANEFTLDTPYEVKNGAFYIGYYINSSSDYPINSGGKDAPNAFLISSPGNMGWSDLNGQGLGKLAFQLLVSGATISNDCASIENFASVLAGPGQSVEIPVKITNGGANNITSISYTVTVNGKTSEEKTVSTPSIPFNGTSKVNLALTTASEEGEFTYTITITKVNGNANTSKHPSATGTITTMSNVKTFPRNVLIEEFTTERCVYCPDAAAGLSSFMTSYPDLAKRVAVVCHHAGFYTDWLTISDSENYLWFYNSGSSYAPAFMYDRYAWDENTPVVSRGKYKEYVENRIDKPSYANITLTANFNADNSAINVTADCERGWNFSSTPAHVTLFLTEDNINAKSQSGATGGFVHQHVLRKVNNTWGAELTWSDNKASYNYTFDLDPSWKTGDLKVVAMISGYDSNNPTNCVVENAAVAIPGTDTGIDSSVSDNVGESARYSLDGRKMTTPKRGLNIIRMNDGSIKKVIVK